MFATKKARLFFLLALPAGVLVSRAGGPAVVNKTGTVTVSVTPGHPSSTFVPWRALGAGIDGHERGEALRMLSPENVRAMLLTGFKPLAYRLRTELAGEAWHWNPRGRWSDAAHKRGYWISDDRPGPPISVCYGYRLPRRGNTIDQGNNDGYSRLDDGDPSTFWKSNPYLDRHYTGEDNRRHPQWIIVDLGSTRNIDTIRILWGIPYATEYEVQYSMAATLELNGTQSGVWMTFPRGLVQRGMGGDVTLRLADQPLTVRYVRILMLAASGIAPKGSSDVRDGLGYAVREVYLGTTNALGNFVDEIRHGTSREHQTIIDVSSTDPWHRATDRDDRIEQPGVDFIFHTGLTNGMPMLTPVGLLYDTPENAAAEIRYLKARGYPVQRLELGEEPDGQLIAPEDYAALYLQWADALHQAGPDLELGGPSLVTLEPELVSWMDRFLQFLASRGRLSDFTFFSFEWYPFDEVCEPTAPQLAESADLIEQAYRRFQSIEALRHVPWLVTEYGYSAFGSRAEVDLEGALLNAEVVGKFLTLGVEKVYHYGYEPNELIEEMDCTWGNNMLFNLDEKGGIGYRTATYWGARMITEYWAEPSDRPHQLYPAHSDIQNDSGQALVTAYAAERPDSQWALLVLNKDPENTWTIKIRFEDQANTAENSFPGPVDLYQFSSRQYLWLAEGEDSHPLRTDPPEHTLVGRPDEELILPPYSLSVVRGHLGDWRVANHSPQVATSP